MVGLVLWLGVMVGKGVKVSVTATVCLLLTSCFPSVMCRCESLTTHHHPASTNQLPPITSSVSNQGRPATHIKASLTCLLLSLLFVPFVVRGLVLLWNG